MYDCGLAFLIAVLVLEIYLVVRFILWLTIFKKKSIYWNDKQGQIKIRGGKCVYDSNETARIKKLENTQYTYTLYDRNLDRIIELQEENKKRKKDPRPNENHVDIEQLQAQLQCGAKGHDKWEYVKKDLVFFRNSPELTGFFFKCSDCGLVITKTAKELTATEKEALKKLKLL